MNVQGKNIFALDLELTPSGKIKKARIKKIICKKTGRSQCLPFIGYPRSLNAISCVNNAIL